MEEVLTLARRHGILRPRDLGAARIPRSYLRRLVERGVLERTGRGLYRYRNKIGLDVASEALREYRRVRGSMDDLWRMAVICRVANVVRPYLEAIA